LKIKDETIDNLTEEIDEEKKKSKKWKVKLDEEIDKNSSKIAELTKTIKDLQAKNF
jgi:hypothetical protein